MTSVLISIETPDGLLDLAAPALLTIGDLLDTLAGTVDGLGELGGWTLSGPDGTPLVPSQTLEEAGVLDGMRLGLVPVGAEGRPIVTSEPSDLVAASDRARRVVPDRSQTTERIAVAVRAFAGRHRPAGARGPMDRMRQAWAWTDHQRRLDWLITRPRLHRSIFIGVVGHRSDEVAERLADTLSSVRLERVVLVDGGLGSSITRRLREVRAGFEEIESGLRRRDVTSIERDLLFGRTNHGTLAVPVDPTAPLPDAATMRRLCGSLPAHAGLIVIDCGSDEQPNAALVEQCDQIVASATASVRRFAVQTVAAVWGDGRLSGTGELYASHPISDDPISTSELAVVIASGWSAIDAATPVPLVL